MANIAVRFYASVPVDQKESGIPDELIYDCVHLFESTILPSPDYSLMTMEQFNQYQINTKPIHDNFRASQPLSFPILPQLKAIDHSSVSIIVGEGLAGGGDLTESRTISLKPIAMPFADHWHGTAQYSNKELRVYTSVGLTDATGRVTLTLTQDGAAGAPLFLSLLSITANAVDASGTALNGANVIIESATPNAVVLRAIRGSSINILLGGIVGTQQYAGAGVSVYVSVVGIKAA